MNYNTDLVKAAYLYDRSRLTQAARNITESSTVITPIGTFIVRLISAHTTNNNIIYDCMVMMVGDYAIYQKSVSRCADGNSFDIIPDPESIAAVKACEGLPDLIEFFTPLLSSEEADKARKGTGGFLVEGS